MMGVSVASGMSGGQPHSTNHFGSQNMGSLDFMQQKPLQMIGGSNISNITDNMGVYNGDFLLPNPLGLGVGNMGLMGGGVGMIGGLNRSMMVGGYSSGTGSYADVHKHSDNPSQRGWVGQYSPELRRQRIDKFHEKRSRRVWTKKVKYDVRKNFADSRLRVKGRFVKKEEEHVMRLDLRSP